MIVMAGSFRRYGVPARAGKSTGKVCRAAGAVRYNRYSTSGRRSGSRHRCSQSIRSRARLMQETLRIVKNHSSVAGAATTLRGHVDSASVTCAGAKPLSRSLSCLVVCLCAWIGLVDVKEAVA